nr:hypothetical protein [Tanacetum cinerariifolium]
MDNPNITIEEYTRLEEEKAYRFVETKFQAIDFNDNLTSEEALPCDPRYFDDLDFFKEFENEFPAIVYNDALKSKLDFLTEYTLSPQHIDEFDLKDKTSLSESDFEERLERIYDRDTHRVQVLDFKGMPELMSDVLYARILMEHRDDDGVVSESERLIPRKGDLPNHWRDISIDGYFLGPLISYTLIRDPVLRLCHRMMVHSIAAPPRTQGERISQLEEEVHGMREVLQGQREVLDSMAHDFSRFITWTVTSLSGMMDMAGVTYTRYSESLIEYQRRSVDDHDDVEEEDDENEDVDIEEDDDAKIIFPYEVQGDQTPPPGVESSDSEFEAKEANDELEVEEAGVEPEAEGADVELEAEEPDGAPEATIGTGSQRPFAVRDFPMGFHEAGESSTARVPRFVAALAPWALRRDLEALHRQDRIREAKSGTSRTEISLLGSKARIGKMEREILHHDLSGVKETLGNVVERLKVLESGENATLKKKLADKEMLLDLTRMDRDRAERRLSESIWWNERFYLEMVRKGAVPKPPCDDEGSKRPRKMPKKFDGDEGPSDPRGPLMGFSVD